MIYIIIACGSVTETPDIDLPASHVYESEPLGIENVDLSAMGDSLTQLFSDLLTYNALLPIGVYFDVMSQADDYCPSFYEYDGNSYWFAACDTDSGTKYDGYSFFNVYQDTDYFQNGTIFDIEHLNGAATVLDQANLSHWGGTALLGDGQIEVGGQAFVSFLNGTFFFEGISEPWVQSGRSLNLLQYHTINPLPSGETFKQLFMTGSIAVDSPSLSAVELTEVMAMRGHPYISCESEPVGRIRLRTVEGIWLELVFDVNNEWELTGACDGCGTVYHDEQLIGELCTDIDGFFAWEESPW